MEYIATPFTYASAHAEPDTRAIVGKIGGSWSPFWGASRPPPSNQGPSSDSISTCGCSVLRILCWQGLELLTDFGLMASDSAGAVCQGLDVGWDSNPWPKKKVISSKYSPLVPLKIGAPPSSFLAPLKLFFLSQTSEIHEIDGGTLLFLYVGRIWSSTHQPAVTPSTSSYRRKPPSWVLSESPQQLSYSSLLLAPEDITHHSTINQMRECFAPNNYYHNKRLVLSIIHRHNGVYYLMMVVQRCNIHCLLL